MTQEHLDAGFFIGAHSTTGSKFKLLLFEQAKQAGDGHWELLMQVRAFPSRQPSAESPNGM